uniref:CRAL-TRIO domain-containing protein n=1 Tax=Meloidogyne incognita TaxID=6306 RepID=A0A914MZA1_MELIC
MYIMDLSGLHFDSNLITMLRGALRSLSTFITEHYVELIRSFVLVNAPEFISMIWSIAKPLLPEKTRQKVIIMGASHWRKEILEMATPKALPAFWNESSENRKQGRSGSMVNSWGPEVFLAELNRSKPVDRNSLYKSDPKQTVASGYYKQLNVSPGKSSYVDLKVEKFETDGHFSFGFYFVEDEKSNQWKMIYPRLNHIPGPTYVPMSGQHKSEMTGIYRLFFSNEHSWFHVLKIRYRIQK